MASANQESNSTASHNLAVQRQQQELIKLFAQHFHHQFYQLTTTNNGSQLPGNNHQLQPSSLLSYQQLIQQYPNEATLLGSGEFDSSSMNLVANNGQLLHNHILRSQQTNTGANLSTMIPPESLVDFTSHNSLNSCSSNGMNIFNALNLTNNQFMLSLQQQSLIQAAAVRQYELRNAAEHHHHHNNQQRNRPNPNEINNNLTGHDEDNQTDGSKEMLKFSINTILGRGSPQSNIGIDLMKLNSSNNQSLANEARAFDDQSNKLFRIKAIERDEQLGVSTAECDPIDSGSDSSSINNPTPIPQSSSTSILINHSLPYDHRSVKLNSTSTMANNQQPLRHQSQAQHHNHHSLPFLASSTVFPWTVTARGKPRRGMMRRAVFSDNQRVGLEKRFQLQKYISKPDRKKLAEKLGLRDSQVKIWFQNRRMKWRNSKERELLSAGGSREQTLPTRNNPNPDLSDVGETIKRLTTTNNGQPNNTLNK